MKAIKRIKIKELTDGDVFHIYFNEDEIEENPQLFGNEIDSILSGHDSIFIVDNSSLCFEGVVNLNGGHTLIVSDSKDVFKLGHYSDLLKSEGDILKL